MSATYSNSIANLLASWSVDRFLQSKDTAAAGEGRTSEEDEQEKEDSAAAAPLLTLRPDDTVLGALQKLSERGVLAAPVVAEGGEDIYRGFFGIGDVVKSLISSNSVQLAMIRSQIGPEPGQPGDAVLQLDQSHWGDLAAEPISALVCRPSMANKHHKQLCFCSCAPGGLHQPAARRARAAPSISDAARKRMLQPDTVTQPPVIISADARFAARPRPRRRQVLPRRRRPPPLSRRRPGLPQHLPPRCRRRRLPARRRLRPVRRVHAPTRLPEAPQGSGCMLPPACPAWRLAAAATAGASGASAPSRRLLPACVCAATPHTRRRACHRVALCEWVRDDVVAGPRVEITDVLTQTDVCRFLLEHRDARQPAACLFPLLPLL